MVRDRHVVVASRPTDNVLCTHLTDYFITTLRHSIDDVCLRALQLSLETFAFSRATRAMSSSGMYGPLSDLRVLPKQLLKVLAERLLDALRYAFLQDLPDPSQQLIILFIHHQKGDHSDGRNFLPR